jgi:hypothetical protein
MRKGTERRYLHGLKFIGKQVHLRWNIRVSDYIRIHPDYSMSVDAVRMVSAGG